jgi:hypothetical protein
MKPLADLQSVDFPDVDPAKLTVWKHATMEAQRRTLWVLPLALAAAAGAFFLVEGFAGAGLIIAIVAVGGILTSGPAHRAVKEAGITRAMIRQARR